MIFTTPSDDASNRPPVGDEDSDASAPQRDMVVLLGSDCADCGGELSARDIVFSIVLGMKNAPRCLPCTSRRLVRDAEELRADLLAHIHRRECFLKAWHEAERIDGATGLRADANRDNAATPITSMLESTNEITPESDVEWDAGDMGCGELVMALRLRLTALRPGAILRVTSIDPAAPEDLPAWCRLCGHALVAMNHPNYWIRRKGE